MSTKKSELTRRELLTRGAAATGVAVGASLVSPAALANKLKAPAQVPRRKLGKTGKKIPILLMGAAMDLDPAFDPKLAAALKYGVNYIDAADCYGGGTCELAVGSFARRIKARKKLWITSKSDQHDPAGFSKTLQTSLTKLNTNYIDMYYLHMLTEPAYLSKALLAVVEKAKKAGKIRHFGFSCHGNNVPELLEVAAKTPWIESVMFRYNFRKYNDKALNKAMDACVKANVGLIAMKTQGSAASFQDKWEPFKQTGKWNKHQAVLKAVWADDRITAAVSHMDTMDKLRENIAAALDRTKLSANEIDELQRYAEATRGLSCDGCDHLCGAAVEAPVQIGDTMRYLMYHDVYGDKAHARDLFAALPAAARRLDGIDFAGANRACPHGVDVAWHMRRAREVLV